MKVCTPEHSANVELEEGSERWGINCWLYLTRVCLCARHLCFLNTDDFTHALMYLIKHVPSPVIPSPFLPNFTGSLLNIPSLPQVCFYRCEYRTTCWNMGSLSRATSLQKAECPSSGSHGVLRAHEALPHPCWVGLILYRSRACSHSHCEFARACHVWQLLFHCTGPLPLALGLFLSPLLQ